MDEVAIEIENVTKSYRTFRGHVTEALRGVSLKVCRGSIFGLLGQNGAGKTTLVKILLGLRPATSGNLSVFRCSPQDPQLRRGVGYLPENLVLPRYLHAEEFLWHMGRLNEVPPLVLKERIRDLLDRVGLREAKQRIGDFSKGMARRLGWAQALINQPALIFLDEPTDGLDPVGRKEMRVLLDELRNQGKTIQMDFRDVAKYS